ncbi:reverse transcriptase domain-containing protein [Tanacetum coccineum]
MEAKQMPIYFISRALQGPEINYTPMEKLVLALVHASKRLKRPKVSINGQILPDFIVERPEDDSLAAPMEVEEELPACGHCSRMDHPVLVEVLKEKSINEAEVLTVLEEEGNTWMTPIYEYLTEETLLVEKKKESSLRLESRRFGLPGEIISDNVKQFRDSPFKDGCEKLNIRQCFASVKHPQANDLVERANKSLGEGMKARLDKGSKDWMEEISHVLWAHRTMIKSSNGDTPFSLTCGTEAMIPAEIGIPTQGTTEIDMVQIDEALKLNLDLLEEKREQSAIRKARSKAKMEKYYNSKVRNANFKLGDLVYQNNDVSHAEDEWNLGAKWEGPYEVIEALGKGAYKLKDRNGKLLPRTWNVRILKQCYIYEM